MTYEGARYSTVEVETLMPIRPELRAWLLWRLARARRPGRWGHGIMSGRRVVRCGRIPNETVPTLIEELRAVTG